VHHDAVVQLQPGDLRIGDLALDLFDSQEFVIELHGPGRVFDHGGDVVDLFSLDLSWHGAPFLRELRRLSDRATLDRLGPIMP
jgi:hypothetical protein